MRGIFQLAGAMALAGAVACAEVGEDSPSPIPAEPKPPSPIPAAVDFLIDQQADDGAWHSDTYGSLRDGAAITSLVLYSFSRLPEEYVKPRRAEIERAYQFLEKGIAKSGYVCNPDGTIDLPTYASALTLASAAGLDYDLTPEVRKKLLDYLVDAQLTETREFKPDNPHYGGWDLSGAQKVLGQTSGTNVSLVRYVLEAFRVTGAGHPGVEKSKRLAREWLKGCQNYPNGDGGFFYTPEHKLVGNKAGAPSSDDTSDPTARSYGSATADGIGCLLHLESDRSPSSPLDAGLEYISENLTAKEVPGFESFKESIGWEQSLRYYYYSGLVDVLPLLPEAGAQKLAGQIAERLVADQRKDGSWQNDSTRMREDDPLICTALALIALGGLE